MCTHTRDVHILISNAPVSTDLHENVHGSVLYSTCAGVVVLVVVVVLCTSSNAACSADAGSIGRVVVVAGLASCVARVGHLVLVGACTHSILNSALDFPRNRGDGEKVSAQK